MEAIKNTAEFEEIENPAEFEYKVSVIVPVYNVENYLRDCLDSLLAQTIDHELMEVLLINDGSTDGSLAICEEYAELFSCFKVFDKENGGVSSARNLGIQNAKGKYIAYLDSDDALSTETLKVLTDFFDTVYENVDLVTYRIKRFQNGKESPLHFRYNFLNKKGLYNLDKFPYISQTSMNIVVKNKFETNIFFRTDLSQGEDQNYILSNLLEKNIIGYVDKGVYLYYVRSNGAVQTEKSPINLFEQRMSMWEEMFSHFSDKVPRYIQALVLANYVWELTSNCLFPYHYDEEKFNISINRIKKILDRIDVEVIFNHPTMDIFHKHFWLSLKTNTNPVVICEEKEMSVFSNAIKIHSRKNIEIILNKVYIENGEATIMGFIKSPIFNYVKYKPVLSAFLNDKEYIIKLFDSVNSYYKCKTHTNNFFGFKFNFYISDFDNVCFVVSIDNIKYSTQFYCVPSSRFNKNLEDNFFVSEGTKISLNDNIIMLKRITDEESKELLLNHKFKTAISPTVRNLRCQVICSDTKKKIWLYCDRYTIGIDNAYYQFQHDFEKKDGILRYYICDNNRDMIKDRFTKEQQNFLIDGGSNVHKALFLKAEYVLCSFSDIKPKIPFSNDAEYAFYRDLPQPKIIYLQHGVLHADLTWTQSAERCKFDKVVVSSEFEKENYINKYNYNSEDILSIGMSRYDHIHKNSVPKNKILFAPSWRSYLTNSNQANNIINYDKLIKSNYYNLFSEFLTSDSLNKVLKENNLFLDAKLHQNMMSALECFSGLSERVNFVEQANIEDYKIFITDISSYVFDYAYLVRPVIYFMPDMLEFKSGMNHYRELDLPWDKAFGNLITDPESVVDEIIRIINNNFIPDPVFKERMDNFYLPMENCAEKLYQCLIKGE